MKKFEYLEARILESKKEFRITRPVDIDVKVDDMVSALNMFGSDGWEVIQCERFDAKDDNDNLTGGYVYVVLFKRERA